MTLRISIITPSFRQGQFIERTIQSVLSQGLAPNEFEYIVCDGGSDDETVDILKRYDHQLSWISEPDNGQTDAVNKGIAMTDGDIIAWINSDDVYYPNALKTVQRIFAENPDIQVIYGDANHIDEHDTIIEPYPTEPWDLNRLKEFCFLCQPAVFFRRSLVETLGSLDDTLNYCMDYELWLRYGESTPFHHVPQKLAGSRLYATNKTLGQAVKVHQEMNDMLVQKYGQSNDKWLLGYAQIYVTHQLKLAAKTPAQRATYLSQLVENTYLAYRRWHTPMSFKTRRQMAQYRISGFLYQLRIHPKLLKLT